MTGLAGTAILAHGNSPTRGKYSQDRARGRRVPGPVRHADGADHRPDPG